MKNDFKFYRKHRKLQKQVANIQFDLSLTDDCIKGCILQFFLFQATY